VVSEFLSITKQKRWHESDVAVTVCLNGKLSTLNKSQSMKLQIELPTLRLSQGAYEGGVTSSDAASWVKIGVIDVRRESETAEFVIEKGEQSRLGRLIYRSSAGTNSFFFEYEKFRNLLASIGLELI
jgi:hypothetical protein